MNKKKEKILNDVFAKLDSVPESDKILFTLCAVGIQEYSEKDKLSVQEKLMLTFFEDQMKRIVLNMWGHVENFPDLRMFTKEEVEEAMQKHLATKTDDDDSDED